MTVKPFTDGIIIQHEINSRAVVKYNSSAFLRFSKEKHFVYIDGHSFIFCRKHFNEHRLHLD